MSAHTPESGTVEDIGIRPTRNSAVTVRPALLVTHVAITCACALLAAVYALTPEPARVEVDLAVSAGFNIRLYVNDLRRAPLIQPIVPGERRKYVFDGIVEDITMLRVDPTDTGGATIDLYSIVVAGRDGILAQFGPQAVGGWTSDATTLIGVDETALHLRTTTANPILTTSTMIPVVRKGSRWTRGLPMVNAPDFSWRLAAASLALLVIAASVDPARRLHLPIGAAAIGLVIAVLAAAPRLPDSPGSAAVAVSRATFVGQSMRPALLASIALALGGWLIGSAAARLDRRRHRGIEPGGPTMRVWLGVVGVVMLAFMTSPDLPGWAVIASTRQFVPNWDSDNLLYWSYLVQHGKLPLRDFWHPYGGTAVFDLGFPTGPTLQWLYDISLFGVFFLAFGRWRGPAAALVTTSVLLIGQRFGLLPGMERYLLSANVVLAYLSVDRDVASRSTRLLFWSACVIALFIEPPQLAFAAVPVGLILAGDMAQRWAIEPSFRVWLIRRLRADFAVPAGFAVLGCAILAITGQLRGFITFYGRLGDAVAYSAWPTGLPELRMTEFPRALVMVASSTILIAIGTYEYLSGGARRVYGEGLAGAGLLTLMVLQKHFTRWMDDQLFLMAVVGIMVLGLGWPGRRRVIEYLVAGATLGALAAMLIVKPTAPAVLTTLAQSFSRVLPNLAILGSNRALAATVNAARFAPERFVMFSSEREAIRVIRAHAGPGGDGRVFALTDDPALYVLNGQQSVWMSNMYDASPVYRQARVVRWLREEAPPHAVLDPDRLTFDGFQMVVRVPHVFSEAAFTYVPLGAAGKLQVLRRRGPNEPVAFSYWRERLGADVDVGRLASVSSFSEAAGCSSACGDLLVVEMPAGGAGRVSVPVTAADLPFSLSFTRVPGETTYRILLDRIWFWNVAKRAGLPHTAGEVMMPGTRIQVRPVSLNEDVLY